MELKNSAAKTATAALNGINSLLGGNKVSRLESENRQLHGEVTELKGSIEQLCTDMQKMRDSHTAEQLRASEQHQREVGNLRRIIDKAKEWFPMLAEFLRIERLCRSVGLSEKHTEELLQGKVLVVTGKLRSEEYRRSFAVEKARLQVAGRKGTARPYSTCSWTECRLPHGSKKSGKGQSSVFSQTQTGYIKQTMGEECKKGHIASNNMLVIPFFCVSIMAVAISEQQEKTVSVSFLLYLLYDTFLCLLPYFQTD